MVRPMKTRKRRGHGAKAHGQNKPVDDGRIELEIPLKELPYTSEILDYGAMKWNVIVRRNMIPVDEIESTNDENAVDDQPKRRKKKKVHNPEPTEGEPAKKKKMVDYISVRLENATKAEAWSCKVRGMITLKKYKEKMQKDEKEVSAHNKKFRAVFHKVNTFKELNTFAPFTAVSKNSSSYLHKDKITIVLQLTVTTVKHDYFPHYDFNKPTQMSDVQVSVEGQKFHVNKAYLAMHSEFFRNLFFSEFAEKDKQLVELKSVNAKIFEEFLQIVYPGRKKVIEGRVVLLLEMADLYQTPMVTALCEEFLLSDDCHIAPGFRLKLADRYSLYGLKARLLRRLDEAKALNKAKDLTGLSPGTLQTIVRKIANTKEQGDSGSKGRGRPGGSRATPAANMEVD